MKNLTLNVSVKKNYSIVVSRDIPKKVITTVLNNMMYRARLEFPKANPFKQGRGSRVPYSQAVPFINRPFQLASRLSVESLAATLNILLLYSYILQKKTVTIIKQGVSQRNHLPFHTYRNYLKQLTNRY